MKGILAILAAALLPQAALAHHGKHAEHSYAGQEARDLKALSPAEVKQYLAGAGMGYAKPAELNSFPGPMHALELAKVLGLSESQKESIGALMKAHKAEARAIGAKLVEAERALEALFRSGSVEQPKLVEAVRHAGALQAEYRLSHLETHRRMRALLTPGQVRRYDLARGYAAPARRGHSAHGH